MFERTASLWRRLTGRSQAQALGAPVDDERRGWVRHPSALPAVFLPANEQEDAPLPARVRDVSRGGVQLIVDRPFEPGALLSIGLPGKDASSLNVLACVVHCQDLPDETWAVGCSFSAELDEDDLQSFGAKKTSALNGDDRNRTRHSCNVKALCQLAVEPDSALWSAKVLNISTNGMALHVDRELAPGTLLSAQLQSSQGQPALTILACVVHVTIQTDGRRITGCNFIRELSEADLRTLV